MGGGNATRKHNIKKHTKIPMAEYHIRFGVPSEVTIDNGTQFDSAGFKDFCNSLGIKVIFAFVYHPQSNGAVERVNGIIFASVVKRLQRLPKGKWVEELPKVLWSLRTTVARPTGFTPFCLLFGEEAMTPEECKTKSFRVGKN